jgi:hypothetical protein
MQQTDGWSLELCTKRMASAGAWSSASNRRGTRIGSGPLRCKRRTSPRYRRDELSKPRSNCRAATSPPPARAKNSYFSAIKRRNKRLSFVPNMAQVRRMLALDAARKERADRNAALEALCVLRSQVSSTATVWHLPNRYPPAGRNRLCGRAVTDAASVAVNECSRWRLAFQPVRSFRSHFGCADSDGSGVSAGNSPMSKTRTRSWCERMQQPIRTQ